jgi:hypothetical protein
MKISKLKANYKIFKICLITNIQVIIVEIKRLKILWEIVIHQDRIHCLKMD